MLSLSMQFSSASDKHSVCASLSPHKSRRFWAYAYVKTAPSLVNTIDKSEGQSSHRLKTANLLYAVADVEPVTPKWERFTPIYIYN